MAKRKSKAVVEPVEEIEDEEIEDIEDLEELADAEAPEDDTDDEEEDEDAPKRTKTKAKKRKVPEREGIGTRELAEALNTDGRNLRVMLRKKGANETRKFKKEGRYHWDTLEEALEELGFDDVDDAQEALTEARDERLEELKNRPKKSKTKDKAKAKAKTKKPKVVDEDDEDEDEED